jgi:hypothetical protein
MLVFRQLFTIFKARFSINCSREKFYSAGPGVKVEETVEL